MRKLVLLLVVILPLVLSSRAGDAAAARAGAEGAPSGRLVGQSQASNLPIELAGQYGGAGYAIAVAGDFAYLGVGPRLWVIDVSRPVSPAVVGQSPVLPAIVRDVHVEGTVAFVAAGAGGLQLLDVSNPAAPVVTGAYDTPGVARSLSVSATLAFIADGVTGGLQIVDVSDPANPTLRGSYATPDGAHGVKVVGHHAYVVAGESGLLILDVSTPSAPRLLSSYATDREAYDVAVEAHLAYVTIETGLEVVDVTNPVAPRHHDDFWTGTRTDRVATGGGRVYFTDGTLHVLGAAEYDPAGTVEGVAVAGNLVYLSDRHGGLEVVDYSDLGAPRRLALLDLLGSTLDVVVRDGRAYVADEASGLKIMSLADPARLQEQGGHPTSGRARSVTLAGDLAYVAGSTGFDVIDVSEPSAAVLRGTYLGAFGQEIVISNTLAYLGGSPRFQVIDVGDLSAPFLRGAPASFSNGVTVEANFAYLAAGTAGLRIVDVTYPETPRVIGSHDTAGSAVSVVVSDGLAYIADANAGLQIVDVNTPSAPAPVATYDTPGRALDVVVAGDLAFVADGAAGVHILDVSNPRAPALRGTYNTTGEAVRISVLADVVYVADLQGGLLLLRVPGMSVTPSPAPAPLPVATPTSTAGEMIRVDSVQQRNPPATNALCTLSAAILAANNDRAVDGCPAGTGTDTLLLPAGVYTLDAIDNYTDGHNGLPGISTAMVIRGNGAGTTAIERRESAPEFRLLRVAPKGRLLLDAVTLRRGRTGGGLGLGSSYGRPDPVPNGGAIINFGVLTLTGTVIETSTASGGGGGIANEARLEIRQSSLLGNSAHDGGALVNRGTVNASRASLSRNTAAYSGGALANISGTVLIHDSTVSENRAAVWGGGTSNFAALEILRSTISGNHGGGSVNYGTTTVVNSTISGNRGYTLGGLVNSRGTVTVTNSTIFGNDTEYAGAASNVAAGAPTFFRHTIVGGDNNNNCLGDGLRSGGHNLDSGASCRFSAPGDISNADPRLGPLQNNGGPTHTHALLPGSPAIDAGAAADCPATDQRGTPRPQDGDGDGRARCDLGSYEAGAPRTFDDSAYAIHYNGWYGAVHEAASGGGYRIASRPGETVSYRTPISATEITLITYRGPNQGKARVFIDGVDKGVVDLYAASPEYRHRVTYSALAPRRHTIAVKLLREKNPSSSGRQLRIDGLIVGGRLLEDNNRAVHYGGWAGATNRHASNRGYRISATAGDSVFFNIRGTHFTWLAARGPGYGQAEVIVDNVSLMTVDLYSPTQHWRVPVQIGGLANGGHRVQIKVLGSKHADSRGAKVVFDGFSMP